MTPPEEYLAQVRRAMAGMDPVVRDDIVRELRSHVAESMAANGGNPGVALAGLGSPAQVGRHYREIYGYGRGFRILFVAIAFLIAIPSVPVLAVGEQGVFPFSFSILFLALAAAWVLRVSVTAGSRTGLLAGIAAGVARAVAFSLTAVLQPASTATLEGLVLLAAASTFLVILGWLPGTAKRAWTGPRADL